MSERLKKLAVTGLALLVAGAPRAIAEGTVKMSYGFVTYGFSQSQRFSHPAGLFYEPSRGELYVADTGNGQIVILDKQGRPETKLTHAVVDPASGNQHPGEPRSLVVRKNGDMLVADNLCNYLDVLDFRGHSVQKIWLGDMLGLANSAVQPRCLATDPAGNVYVGVSGSPKEIVVLSPNLKLKALMGVEEDGASKNITSIWVDKAGRVYATYATGVCVRIYGPDGRELVSWGTHDAGPNNFSLPQGIVTDYKGRAWVVDTLRHVVSVFDLEPSGQEMDSTFFSLALGGQGGDAGDLTFPTAIAGDGSTHLFVLESAGARVQAFDLEPDGGTSAPKGP